MKDLTCNIICNKVVHANYLLIMLLKPNLQPDKVNLLP